MARLSPEFKKIRPIVIRILQKNGVSKAGIFGSYARGEQTPNSDLDLLVKIRRKMSVYDFVGIKLELEDALKLKVDLVEYEALKPLLKDKVLKEAIKVL